MGLHRTIIILYFLCFSAIFASELLENFTIADYALSNFIMGAEMEKTACSESMSVKSEILAIMNYIAEKYLNQCVNVILYDNKYDANDPELNFDLRQMLKNFRGTLINAQIKEMKRLPVEFLQPIGNECRNFILLLTDITWTAKLLGPLRYSKVVVVTPSSRWKIEEYLEDRKIRDVVNIIVVSYNWKQTVLFSVEELDDRASAINLYTHNLYTDGLGSSSVRFLTSWRCGKLMRDIELFPRKMSKGFNGRQFVVAAGELPPFTLKRKIALEEDSNESGLWDGVEIRLLRLLSTFMNYTVEIVEPKLSESILNGPSERVIDEVISGRAEIGSAGVYVTNDRISSILPSAHHTMDCATFITKTSSALPGHRAILGPFQWTVWLALTLTYMSAIIPLTFADSHSLKPLMKNPWLIETMFWHVFGTFTNCFTFSDEKSWTKPKKSASRLFIGIYWAFTIIVTACYTGSIVSFITLYVFPSTIDHVDQLVAKNFKIGMLRTEGWSSWFNNSDHEKTKWLLRDAELIDSATHGLLNVSRTIYLPMFRPYAFLGGRSQMEYIVRTNYTHSKKKKALLHISKDCFVPFGVSFAFPRTAAFSDLFNEYILRVQQSGLMGKILNDFKWDYERSETGKLLQAGSGASLKEITPLQRKLTLEDTEGMYLLMGSGYLIGAIVLIMEWIHFTMKNRKTVSVQDRLSCLFFWRWTAIRYVVGFIGQLLTALLESHFLREKYDKRSSNYTQFKKYDSRILGTQSKIWKSISFSDVQFCRKHNLQQILHRRSLPDLNNGNVSDDLKSWPGKIHKSRRKDLDIIFGSINSLPWNFNDVHHLRNSNNFFHRPQSC